jgi:tetratricopeptide (TPR) repeat protein
MTEPVLTEYELKLKAAIKEGNDLWRADDFKGMLRHYLTLRQFFEDAPPAFQRFYYCNLAIAYREAGQIEQAIEGYLKALQVKGEENESDIATINANLACAQLFQNRPDEALIYLSQPESYHRTNVPVGVEEKGEWAFRLGNALESKARALHSLEDDGAIKAAKEAVDLLLEYCADSKATGRAIRTLATCWEARSRQ